MKISPLDLLKTVIKTVIPKWFYKKSSSSLKDLDPAVSEQSIDLNTSEDELQITSTATSANLISPEDTSFRTSDQQIAPSNISTSNEQLVIINGDIEIIDEANKTD